MKNIAVVCGGYSGEDVISYKSAETILKHLDSTKYRIFKVSLSVEEWTAEEMNGLNWQINKSDFSFELSGESLKVDAVVNIIHGTPGEDGKLQGYFDVIGIPYTGCDVLTSSLTFNKGFCNQYLKQQGIEVAESVLLNSGDHWTDSRIVESVGLPCFVKPNDGGSSIGVTKVKHISELEPAIKKAFSVSDRVLIESFVEGTEITCGVIEKDGVATPVAVTEIVFESEFFDFDAKYTSSETQEITPARIKEDDYQRTMDVSARIYRMLGCRGFFRADYILTTDGRLNLIEVNTVPGMSAASLMPQQLEYVNFDLSEILDYQIRRISS